MKTATKLEIRMEDGDRLHVYGHEHSGEIVLATLWGVKDVDFKLIMPLSQVPHVIDQMTKAAAKTTAMMEAKAQVLAALSDKAEADNAT